MSAKKPQCTIVEEALLEAPVGTMQLNICTNGVHSLSFATATSKLPWGDKADVTILKTTTKCPSSNLLKVVEWLRAFFNGNLPAVARMDGVLQLCCLSNEQQGRPATFRVELYKQLRRVPFGQTTDYATLAKAIGKPKAYRATGRVMASNPVPLILPCHRVIMKNGKLGNYCGGKLDNIKQALIQFESSCVDKKAKVSDSSNLE